jgi:hypothetical protein
MKLIWSFFEQLSGLKISFHKNKIFCFGKAREGKQQYKQLFDCEAGSLPFRYLVIPIHYRKLKISEWYPVESRFEVLDVKNRCLLNKWLFNLINEQGVWQELVHNKYLSKNHYLKSKASRHTRRFGKSL